MEWTIGGRRLTEVLVKRRREIVRGVMSTLLAEVDFYRSLPAEELDGDIEQVVADNVRLVAWMLRDGETPALGTLGTSARKRAEEGVPLEAVLTAYHVGTHAAWRAVTDAATEEDAATVRAVTDLVLGYLTAVVATVSGSYVDELRSLSRYEENEHHTLMSALLAGDPGREAVRRAGIGASDAYTVLALHVDRHPDEDAVGVNSSIAGRRKVRRIRDALDRHHPRRSLSMLDGDGGIILLPADRPTDLDALLAAITKAAGTPVVAAAGHADASAVAPMATQAREVLALVRKSNRPPGVYRLRDVLLDYQLSHVTPATGGLIALLAPLTDNPELLHTLKTHMSTNLNRRRTAALLHVHPNTVDNRLRRVTELTDLDPTVPSQLLLIAAALAAHQ